MGFNRRYYTGEPKKIESFRYCAVCGKKTKWCYNRNTGHSECTECGNRYAGKKADKIAREIISGEKDYAKHHITRGL